MAAEQQQQAQWDAPLQQLLAHGVIDGYALISHPGLVLAACGELAGAAGEQPPPALRQLHALFHSPAAAPDHLELCGQQALIVQRSESSAYAVSRGKQLGLTAHYLPAGVLVTVFSRPQLLQAVAPRVEAVCDRLRQP